MRIAYRRDIRAGGYEAPAEQAGKLLQTRRIVGARLDARPWASCSAKSMVSR